jgi:hypothetical protein
MDKQKFPKPLWVIHFDRDEDLSWAQKASLEEPLPEGEILPSSDILSTPENQLIALDFLEKVNHSFREITEAYFSKVQDEHTKSQVEDIRKKFDALDQWLHWLRNKIHHKPPETKPPPAPK